MVEKLPLRTIYLYIVCPSVNALPLALPVKSNSLDSLEFLMRGCSEIDRDTRESKIASRQGVAHVRARATDIIMHGMVLEGADQSL